MKLFVQFERMGREMHPKMTWQARIKGERPKDRRQPSHGSLRHAPYLLHIIVRGLHVVRYLPQTLSVLRPYPTLSLSFLLAQAIFEPNPFPYKYPNILKPSHSSYLSAYEDGTECSETSAYKIQTPGNYPEESTQHSEQGESLKSRRLQETR